MAQETVSAPAQPNPHPRTLFKHTLHPHQPRNINLVHEAEQKAGNFNQQVAVGITKVLSSMITFWLVGLVITFWIVFNFTSLAFDKIPWPLLLTILNIPQISMMIGLGVGQGVLGRKQELQSEEQFLTTQKTYHDIEQIIQHLSVQDEEILRQTQMIIQLMKTSGCPFEEFLPPQRKDGNGTNAGAGKPGPSEDTA